MFDVLTFVKKKSMTFKRTKILHYVTLTRKIKKKLSSLSEIDSPAGILWSFVSAV